MTTLLPFQLIQPDVGAGSPLLDSVASAGRPSFRDPVGVTGVGKSTVLAHLAEFGLTMPCCRIGVLTDRLIILAMQVSRKAAYPAGD